MPKAEAQEVSSLQKTWMLLQTWSLKDEKIVVNGFSKLRFDAANMYITLQRSNNEMAQPYRVTGNKLKGRYVEYIIESITDSTLTLSMPNDLKMYFLAQGYSPCGDSLVKKIGEINGHPFYKSMSYLMPVQSGEPLFKAIEKAIHFDKQKQIISVSFSFIVDENGTVQDAKIQQSVSAEIDAIVLEQVQKSSGKWQPPLACGSPAATFLSLRFEYDPVVH